MIGDDHEDNEEFNSYIEDEDAHDNQDIQLANDSHIADERLHPVDSPMKMDGDNDKDKMYDSEGVTLFLPPPTVNLALISTAENSA